MLPIVIKSTLVNAQITSNKKNQCNRFSAFSPSILQEVEDNLRVRIGWDAWVVAESNSWAWLELIGKVCTKQCIDRFLLIEWLNFFSFLFWAVKRTCARLTRPLLRHIPENLSHISTSSLGDKTSVWTAKNFCHISTFLWIPFSLLFLFKKKTKLKWRVRRESLEHLRYLDQIFWMVPLTSGSSAWFLYVMTSSSSERSWACTTLW